MQKLLISGCFLFLGLNLFSQNAPTPKASLKLRAFQQVAISGVAPAGPIVEVGGKETAVKPTVNKPNYLIYLIAYKVPYIKIERVWIKQKLYSATITKIKTKPVVVQNGKKLDTLIKYTDEAIWQLVLKGPNTSNVKPKKDIALLVADNDLVVRFNDKNGKLYTRTVKSITNLEPFIAK